MANVKYMAIAMTVAMAIDIALANATTVVIVQPYQEKNLNIFLYNYTIFSLGSSLWLRPWELPQPHAGISLYSPPLVKVQTQYSTSKSSYCIYTIFTRDHSGK